MSEDGQPQGTTATSDAARAEGSSATPTSIPNSSADETTLLLRPAIPDPGGVVAAVAPREGLLLGPVSLVRLVGQGGMGTVWLGRHQLLGRDVAVKFLSAALRDDQAPGRFVQEARAAAGVRHPHLVQVHDCDLLGDGTPYLVMEYVAGPTLRQAIARAGRLDLPTAILLLEDVAAAVDELHRHGVIHRDLKPGNVLLSPAGAALVADFGLAVRRAHAVGGGPPGTEPAAPAGTPAYMAPEAFAGEASARADVYALGVMAYEMLAGAPPFAGGLDALRDAHANHPPPPGPLRAAGIPDNAIEVIERAAHKRPLFRYKTAADFVRALRGACAGPVPGGEQRKRTLIAALAARTAPTDPLGGPSSPAPDGAPPGLEYERAPVAPAGPSSSYYETIARLSSQKREQHDRLTDQRGPGDLGPARGWVPVPPPPGPEPDALPAGVLRVDVPCRRCGFNLRVAPPDARCPECAHPVADSVRVYEAVLSPTYLRPLGWMTLLLCAAAPFLWVPSADWVNARDGAGLAAVGLTLAPTSPAHVLADAVIGAFSERPPPAATSLLSVPGLFLLAAAAAGMPAWPAWPAAPERPRPRRRAARVWAVRLAAGGLVGAGVLWAGMHLFARPDDGPAAQRPPHWFAGPLLVGLAPLTFACFRRVALAARMTRRPVLAGVLTALTFVLTAGAVAVTLLALAAPWAARAGHRPSAGPIREGARAGHAMSVTLPLAEAEGVASAARVVARTVDAIVLAGALVTLSSLLALRRRLPKLPIALFPDDQRAA